MGLTLELLNFDDDEPGAVPLELTPEYLHGFEAGKAVATEAMRQEQDVLNAELAAAITDMGFGYTEARIQLLEDLAPLLDAICTQMLPAVSDRMLQSHLLHAMTEAANTCCDADITLRLHPQNLSAVQTALAAQNVQRITVVPDPALGPIEARWQTSNQESAIDLAPLVATIRNALNTIIDESERKASHG